MRAWTSFCTALALVALAGCAPLQRGGGGPLPPASGARVLPPQIAAQNFLAVLGGVEPVAEALCRASGNVQNCDFQIAIDKRRGAPPNAFQTVDEMGRPIIAFTLSLIATAQNRDELAFIMGHEAGHHIAGHLARQEENAIEGAVVAGVLASLSGADSRAIDRAAQMGAGLAARRYSKDFELEADMIGTRIALISGYNPVRGAAFFDRIPDPGDRFLGTHPANDDRKALVARETARLQAAGLRGAGLRGAGLRGGALNVANQ